MRGIHRRSVDFSHKWSVVRKAFPRHYVKMSLNYVLLMRLKKESIHTQIARFMGPTWGPPGSCRPQMGPTLAPLALLSGYTPPSKSLRTPCSTSVKPVVSIKVEGRYLENETFQAVEICNDFILQGSLRYQPILQNKKDRIAIKLLRNTTSLFRPDLNGSEF